MGVDQFLQGAESDHREPKHHERQYERVHPKTAFDAGASFFFRKFSEKNGRKAVSVIPALP
jgi:hypothetical protein